jgi:hypothetical protein
MDFIIRKHWRIDVADQLHCKKELDRKIEINIDNT